MESFLDRSITFVYCIYKQYFSDDLIMELVSLESGATVWRADRLERPAAPVWPTGWPALDAELPGGGWPAEGLTELLCECPGTLEARLLMPALAGADAPVALVGSPEPPHPPGWWSSGLVPSRLVWVQADAVRERLWAAEQLVRGRAAAVLLWLDRVPPGALRRLQVLSAGAGRPVFVCRPWSAAAVSSPAPLRLRLASASGWALQVELLKRRGPPLLQPLNLPSVPGGLSAVLSPRQQRLGQALPDGLLHPVEALPLPALVPEQPAANEVNHALGRLAPAA